MTPDLRKAQARAERLAAALEHSGIGDWTWERATDVLNVSATAARLFGVAPGDHDGWERMRGVLHPDDRDRARAAAAAVISGESDFYEVQYRARREGQWRWLLTRANTTLDDDGDVIGMVGTVEDITVRKRAEDADRVLARTGELFAESLDVQATLEGIARLLLESVADGCSLDLLDDDGRLRRVVLLTRDPAKASAVEELERRFPTPLDADAGNTIALRTGEPQLFPVITEEHISAVATTPEHLELWRRVDMKSVICAPMIARGRTLGVLTVVSHTDGVHFDAQDLELVVELARRAALAIDNARLHHGIETVAERMTRLQSLTAALSEAVTTAQVAEAVMRHGIADLGADAGVIALVTPDGDELEIVASTGYPEAACMGPGRRWPLDAALPITEATRSGRAIFVASPDAWTERYGPHPTSASRAWAALPLSRQGTARAALLWTWFAPHRFARDEASLMNSISALAGQALERSTLYEAERDARSAAELANGVKTRFLAMMSHELRTPLNAIVGYSDLMVHGVSEPLGEKQRAYLERIHGSAMFLSQIINEILAFSQLEAGREEVVAEDVDVRDVVRSATEMVRPMAIAGGLELGVDVPAQPVLLRTDRRKLTQVVLNLMSNAVKFTERGSVSATLAAEDDAIVVRIVDTGIGVAPDAIDRIFEPFTQVDSSRTRRQGGSGLGLTVAARFVRLLGGRIEVASEPGRGSTFTVRLPAAPSSPTATSLEASLAPSPTTRPS